MALMTKITKNNKVNYKDIASLLRNDSTPVTNDLQLLLKRERARADRTGQPFSQILLQCKKLNQSMMNYLIRAVYSRIRFTDEVKWINRHELAIVLPDTTSEGARELANTILNTLAIEEPMLHCKIYTYPAAR